MLRKIFFYLTIFVIIINFNVYSEIPIIVITPSKKPQSLSSVGTSIQVITEKEIEKSGEFFLGNILSNSSTSINFFQSGGHGTSSAIQLRGLPKRYSTVYIDGVKMSDPSSVSNDFDFNHILKSQISSVEILRGNQSSVYGSGAIGGAININTKKGKPGIHKTLEYTTGSYGTHNLSTSISGADEKRNFFVGFERLNTDGISAMSHNSEKDRYRNNSLAANYQNNISNNLKFFTNLRITDTYLQYDKVINSASTTHSEEADEFQSSSSIGFDHQINEKFSSKFTFANTYVKRIYPAAIGSGNTQQDNYYGERYSYSYMGNYKFNLDNGLVFGLEKENDKIGYNQNLSGRQDKGNNIISKYFDFQSRIKEKTYVTLGLRFDEHSIAGNEDSFRASFAHNLNKSTKIKSSLGTGFRFPSLYEMYFVYAANDSSLSHVNAEKSKSFDIGIERNFNNLNLDIEANYFNLSYSDVLEGWKTGISSGAEYTTQNMPGRVKSQGLELISNWIINPNLNFNLNYTYTSTYDGAEQDDPDKNSSYTNSQIVRVPRNLINLKTNFKVKALKNFDFSLVSKLSDKARDYGNGNRTYNDEVLNSYFLNNFFINYNAFNNYDISISAYNIFNEKYETAKDYSQIGRSLNFTIKKRIN